MTAGESLKLQPAAGDPLPYAMVGVTKRHWNVAVFDHDTGERIPRVVEANADEGWFLQARIDDAGQRVRDRAGDLVFDRIERKILILRCRGCGEPIRRPDHWPPHVAASPLDARPTSVPDAPVRTLEDDQPIRTPEDQREIAKRGPGRTPHHPERQP